MQTYVELNTSNDETFYTAGYNEIFAVKGDADLCNINLYKNKSEKIKLVKDIELIKSVEGVFRESISIIEPIFTLELNQNEAFNFNYVYIEQFNRYYYVVDVICVASNLYEIRCYLDVLMSYKDGILNQTCVVDRSESDGNPYIDDKNLVAISGYNLRIETLDIIDEDFVRRYPLYPPSFDDGSIVITGFAISAPRPEV